MQHTWWRWALTQKLILDDCVHPFAKHIADAAIPLVKKFVSDIAGSCSVPRFINFENNMTNGTKFPVPFQPIPPMQNFANRHGKASLSTRKNSVSIWKENVKETKFSALSCSYNYTTNQFFFKKWVTTRSRFGSALSRRMLSSHSIASHPSIPSHKTSYDRRKPYNVQSCHILSDSIH